MIHFQNINCPLNQARHVFSLAVIFSVMTACQSCTSSAKTSKAIEIRAIYGSPAPLWDKGHRLDELKVNAVFLNWHSINDRMLERSASEGAGVYAEFPLLNGEGYVQAHPEAWAVDRYGNKAEPATWFMGVCATDPAFREHRVRELKELLQRFAPDGIWLDYLHWHAQFEDPEPILPETCFCDRCIRTFEESAGIKISGSGTAEKADQILAEHDTLWRDWRCNIIAGWVRDMREIVKEHNPEALLGIFHCPWDDDEFDGARRRILGLDYDLLRDITDVFSPMVYHGRMEREAEWVKNNIEWFCRRLEIRSQKFPKVWPIVQAYDDPHPVTPEEFERVLLNGITAEATGIMMFTSRAVAASDAKTETLKRVYSGLTD